MCYHPLSFREVWEEGKDLETCVLLGERLMVSQINARCCSISDKFKESSDIVVTATPIESVEEGLALAKVLLDLPPSLLQSMKNSPLTTVNTVQSLKCSVFQILFE